MLRRRGALRSRRLASISCLRLGRAAALGPGFRLGSGRASRGGGGTCTFRTYRIAVFLLYDGARFYVRSRRGYSYRSSQPHFGHTPHRWV
jgi:hypothetical protein